MDAGNTECLTEPDWAAFIAIDWAGQKHDWALKVPGHSQRERGQMAHTPEAIDTWVMQLRERFGDRPIAVTLEQSRGAPRDIETSFADTVDFDGDFLPVAPGEVCPNLGAFVDSVPGIFAGHISSVDPPGAAGDRIRISNLRQTSQYCRGRECVLRHFSSLPVPAGPRSRDRP